MFYYLDLALMTMGFKLYIRNHFEKLMNGLFFVYFESIATYQLYSRFDAILRTSKNTRLHSIASFTYTMVSIFVQLWLLFKRSPIKRFINELSSNLSNQDRYSMRRFSLKLLALFVIGTIFGITDLLVFGRAIDGVGLTFIATLVNSCLRCLAMNHMARSGATYVFFYRTIYLIDGAQVEKLVQNLIKHRPIHYNNEILSRHQILNFRAQLDSLFSPLVASWLLNLLINLAGNMVIDKNEPISYLMMEWLFFAYYSIITGISLIYVIRNESNLVEKSNHLIYLIRKSTNGGQRLTHDARDFIGQLKERPLLTGCQQFDIKPSLFLNFIGSIITFAVLFIQIIGQ